MSLTITRPRSRVAGSLRIVLWPADAVAILWWQGKTRLQDNDRRDADCPDSGQGIADKPPDLGGQAGPAQAQGLKILEAAFDFYLKVLVVTQVLLDDVPA
jgi:hypothetical protein